jgi:hypothetical protein
MFLIVMLVLAGLATLAGIVVLIVTFVSRARRADRDGGQRPPGSRWYELLLGAGLLVLLIGILIAAGATFFPSGAGTEALRTWRSDPRESAFLTIMLLGCAALLVWIVIHALLRIPRRTERPALQAPGEAAQGIATPSASRLLGIVLPAVAFLVLNWTYLDRATQHAVMVQLVYPAAMALALVLLFDKATRAWSVKSGAEHIREWLHCDSIAFLLLLGFVNLRSADPAAYGALFWDVLALALALLAFWLVDRKASRFRFLLSYAYFVLLPLLLLIWQAVQGIEVPAELSWWSTIWPFFTLAVAFFVFEIIALIVTDKPDAQGGRIVKDVLFVVLCGIVLLVAIPAKQ